MSEIEQKVAKLPTWARQYIKELKIRSEPTMYVNPNFKTKKAFKEHIKDGKPVDLFQPGLGPPAPTDGKVSVEGPHFPAAHTWYAVVTPRSPARGTGAADSTSSIGLNMEMPMRITKKWLRDQREAIRSELHRLAKMSGDELVVELKKVWPSYQHDHETTPQHELAILVDLLLDRKIPEHICN